MPDMLVALNTLPSTPTLAPEYSVELAKPWDRETILNWVTANFSAGWASEVACGMAGHPCKVLVARRGHEMLGFACYDVTFPGFFGPTGISEAARGSGLGKALLIEAMHRLHHQGYVYAFIGDAGPVDFYAKVLGAMPVPEGLQGGYTPPLID
ncbi:GNAT family N-acetyltransferase [Salinispirillum sp. LH 10-3-1]|uniref:GNAT family N-acetyltransferase n=1 Tax=Salinispirillum sp. LH 10-3-1 TaxID=2952525 RepID=A0AB38YCU2_9GAMM